MNNDKTNISGLKSVDLKTPSINEEMLNEYLSTNFLTYLRQDKSTALKKFLQVIAIYLFNEFTHFDESLKKKERKEQSTDHFDQEAYQDLANYLRRIKKMIQNYDENRPVSKTIILEICDNLIHKLDAVRDIKEELFGDHNFETPRKLKDLIKNLVTKHCEMYEFDPKILIIEDINYNPNICCEAAQSIALLIKELVSNSLRHGLQDIPDPKIEIYLESEADNFVLTIKDNGKGLPPRINYGQGIREIFHIVKGIYRGKIKYGNYSYGLKVRIEIPIENIFLSEKCLHEAA